MDKFFTPGIALPRQRGREDPSLNSGDTIVDPPTLTNLTLADLAFLDNLAFPTAPLVNLDENFALEHLVDLPTHTRSRRHARALSHWLARSLSIARTQYRSLADETGKYHQFHYRLLRRLRILARAGATP